MAPSRGPLEEAMKAKLRQMQVARDADVASTQEELRSALANLSGKDEELQRAEARLQSFTSELGQLAHRRREEEALVEERASMVQQNAHLRSQLEQAYLVRSQLEVKLAEEAQTWRQELAAAVSAAARDQASLEEGLTEQIEQAKASAAAWALECRGLEDDARAAATELSSLREEKAHEQEEHQASMQRFELELEELRAELEAALAAEELAESKFQAEASRCSEAEAERQALRLSLERRNAMEAAAKGKGAGKYDREGAAKGVPCCSVS
eukprot:TRINITY_DN15409_c0_g1_i1.p1 TRINITY_DN15409_c0_g1~~TRINITY_DN15409_c0_g1_i1.p1  ORF type:complete len:282 (-),score=110.63 TRINITY_DN15409_c0_g1_i1:56-862(-)